MIIDPFDRNACAPADFELTVVMRSLAVEPQAELSPVWHDTLPQTVDWDAVDAERCALFP